MDAAHLRSLLEETDSWSVSPKKRKFFCTETRSGADEASSSSVPVVKISLSGILGFLSTVWNNQINANISNVVAGLFRWNRQQERNYFVTMDNKKKVVQVNVIRVDKPYADNKKLIQSFI